MSAKRAKKLDRETAVPETKLGDGEAGDFETWRRGQKGPAQVFSLSA